MQQLETRGITERWIKGSWEEYLEAIKNLPENQGKSYYYNGYYRLEMTPIGFEHARDHHVVFLGVSLYAILKLAVLESALQQARTRDQSQVGRWLITQFQG